LKNDDKSRQSDIKALQKELAELKAEREVEREVLRKWETTALILEGTQPTLVFRPEIRLTAF
jgi:cell division protein FtsB